MELLALCSKILYDHDYLKAKKKLLNIPPKVLFKTQQESEQYKNNVYERLEKSIKCALELTNEFQIQHWGVSDGTIGYICDFVKSELMSITKNEEWSEKIAFENIWDNISCLFYTIHSSELWDVVYEFSDIETVSRMIYENVYWYLEQRVFSKIICFECKKCKDQCDYIDEITKLCSTCS
jgi:hypothetical protein